MDILVVDDEHDIRELVSGILEDEGFFPRTAADSDGALAAQDDFAVADKKLSNPSFREKAPADIVSLQEEKRAEAEATIGKLEAQLAELMPT